MAPPLYGFHRNNFMAYKLAIELNVWLTLRPINIPAFDEVPKNPMAWNIFMIILFNQASNQTAAISWSSNYLPSLPWTFLWSKSIIKLQSGLVSLNYVRLRKQSCFLIDESFFFLISLHWWFKFSPCGELWICFEAWEQAWIAVRNKWTKGKKIAGSINLQFRVLTIEIIFKLEAQQRAFERFLQC